MEGAARRRANFRRTVFTALSCFERLVFSKHFLIYLLQSCVTKRELCFVFVILRISCVYTVVCEHYLLVSQSIFITYVQECYFVSHTTSIMFAYIKFTAECHRHKDKDIVDVAKIKHFNPAKWKNKYHKINCGYGTCTGLIIFVEGKSIHGEKVYY